MWGGGAEALMTKFRGAIQKPLIQRCPNFVIFSFYLKTYSDQILAKLARRHKTFQKQKVFFFLKIVKIDMGGQFWVEKEQIWI